MLVTGRDALAVFLGVGVLSLVLALTVFDRTRAVSWAPPWPNAAPWSPSTATGPGLVGLRGVGGHWTCRGTVRWTGSGAPAAPIELPGSQLGPDDVGRPVPVAGPSCSAAPTSSCATTATRARCSGCG